MENKLTPTPEAIKAAEEILQKMNSEITCPTTSDWQARYTEIIAEGLSKFASTLPTQSKTVSDEYLVHCVAGAIGSGLDSGKEMLEIAQGIVDFYFHNKHKPLAQPPMELPATISDEEEKPIVRFTLHRHDEENFTADTSFAYIRGYVNTFMLNELLNDSLTDRFQLREMGKDMPNCSHKDITIELQEDCDDDASWYDYKVISGLRSRLASSPLKGLSDEEMIGFAEWSGDNKWTRLAASQEWVKNGDGRNTYVSTAELLQLYKESKGSSGINNNQP